MSKSHSLLTTLLLVMALVTSVPAASQTLVGDTLTQARAADGAYISWLWHVQAS